MHDDWFTYLKSGLISLPMDQLDALENTAIERGWRGDRWWLPLSDSSGQLHAFEPVRLRLLQPFESMLRQPMQAKKGIPKKQTWTGNSMSEAIRRLWTSLGVTRSLEDWDAHPLKEGLPHQDFHLRVLETMESLLDNLEMAFRKCLFRFMNGSPSWNPECLIYPLGSFPRIGSGDGWSRRSIQAIIPEDGDSPRTE